MISNYLPQILQTVATIVTVLTFFMRIQKSNSEKHKAEMKLMEQRLKEDNQRNRDDIKHLESKVDKQDDFIKESIIGKLSSLESGMKSVTNILNVIQEHFIKKGAK